VRTLYDRAYDIKNNLSLCYIKLKNYEQAEQILNEILTNINNDRGYAGDAAAAYYNLGKLSEEKNDLNKALIYYKQSLSTYPSELRKQKVKEIENKK
jgi:tetratricopeptide (TPR) repeat protein